MTNEELLNQLALCIERGKANLQANYPPDMKGEDGASELTETALQNGINPSDILSKALMKGMQNVGDKFSKGQAFIPDLLIAAKAMYAAMDHLKPFFESGEVQHKGSIILGTVAGDLHDIGKNLLKMVMEGNGWKVIDIGTDVSADKFLDTLKNNPQSMVGMSALLTTTMLNMEPVTQAIKKESPHTKVFVGGAPLTQAFNDKIGADGYFPSPQALVKYLDSAAEN